MARTKHHNDAKGGKILKLEDKYTGWVGEYCWRQRGRKFLKRWKNRHNRRHHKRNLYTE